MDRPDEPRASDPVRRTIIKGVIGAGAGLSLAPALGFAQGDQAAARPREGDLLVKVDDAALEPLTPDDVPAAGPIQAWALAPEEKVVRSGSRLNRLLLVKLDPDTMSSATQRFAAGSVVAYTAICTHEGCDIGGWIAAEHLLYCECHESKFDPRDAARVVDGPAPRSLPALPLKVVDGLLVVARPFTARVGGEVV
jgi:Rieske Fe-S protein